MGGKSAEHEVSLQSARNIVNALDRNKYKVVPIGISKDGKWLKYKDTDFLDNTENPKKIKLKKNGKKVSFSLERPGYLDVQGGKTEKIDVVFPVLHGPYGEDGSVQGYLKLVGVPFVGASVLGSAVGMDKDIMKRLLNEAGINNARCIVVRESEDVSYNKIKTKLGKILFIKPANLGSSVGVSKVRNEKEFKTALKEAFMYDKKVLIEEMIEGRELECAILGNATPVASVVGEVILKADFYSYDAKYIDPEGASTKIPADNLDKSIVKKIQNIAINTYKTLGCEGLGRVDVFLKQSGEVYVNEINTLPGFTAISMYPKLFAESGLPVTPLLDKLINLAVERYNLEKNLKN